jgi:hypothetical protein
MFAETKADVKAKINAIEISYDCLTVRTRLVGFSRYLETIEITNILVRIFSFLRKSKKVIGIRSIFHQLLCYFFDGTSFHLTRFDPAKTKLRLRFCYCNFGKQILIRANVAVGVSG